MNNFAVINKVQSFKRVTYFTVSINNDLDLFTQFINKFSFSNDLALIRQFLIKMGKQTGAKENYFRFENAAMALPPRFIELENNLRLYCHRLNDNVVFLFNGGVKTALKAQDCKNVKDHFKQANQLAVVIDRLIKENEINWINDFTDIKFSTDLIIEL